MTSCRVGDRAGNVPNYTEHFVVHYIDVGIVHDKVHEVVPKGTGKPRPSPLPPFSSQSQSCFDAG